MYVMKKETTNICANSEKFTENNPDRITIPDIIFSFAGSKLKITNQFSLRNKY